VLCRITVKPTSGSFSSRLVDFARRRLGVEKMSVSFDLELGEAIRGQPPRRGRASRRGVAARRTTPRPSGRGMSPPKSYLLTCAHGRDDAPAWPRSVGEETRRGSASVSGLCRYAVTAWVGVMAIAASQPACRLRGWIIEPVPPQANRPAALAAAGTDAPVRATSYFAAAVP
jgi:hypothetical protein